MLASKVFDVLIVGGGPAGLAIATGLSRQLHTAVVLDSGAYRNARTKHMHNFPGWDHQDPAAFRAKARGDLQMRYESIEFQEATISHAKRLDDGTFELSDGNGRAWHGKKIALATGMKDVFDNEVQGFEECWAYGIFHCLFCHGFEERGQKSVGLLVTDGLIKLPHPLGPAAIIQHISRQAKRLSEHVVIYTNGRAELAESLKSNIRSSHIAVDDRKIDKLSLIEQGPNVKLNFSDGSSKIEGFLVARPSAVQRSADLIDQLGLELTPTGDVKVQSPMNETSVPGVFAAGDIVASAAPSVAQATYLGAFAGAGLVGKLQAESEANGEL